MKEWRVWLMRISDLYRESRDLVEARVQWGCRMGGGMQLSKFRGAVSMNIIVENTKRCIITKDFEWRKIASKRRL